MKMADFKALPLEDKLTKLNKHLLSLKDLPGRLEDKFKNDEFEFSYSLLKKNAKDLGITVDGKNYRAYYLLPDIPDDVSKQQKDTEKITIETTKNDIENNNIVKQKQQIVKSENIELTTEEILFVKELFAKKQDVVKDKQLSETLFMPQFIGTKKTTGISVYVELWERWGKFKKQYAQYSGTDLMALALEEFMNKYDEGSDS